MSHQNTSTKSILFALLANLGIAITKTDTANQLIASINTCESELKKAFPAIQWMFFEPDNKD